MIHKIARNVKPDDGIRIGGPMQRVVRVSDIASGGSLTRIEMSMTLGTNVDVVLTVPYWYSMEVSDQEYAFMSKEKPKRRVKL